MTCPTQSITLDETESSLSPQGIDFDSIRFEIYTLPSTTIYGREVRDDLGAAPRCK
ncbi:MAG TPA: hypothetical protein VMM76_24140 [Pirellulaceae bacterium]|nr:hypothetical protein [Pirellulaceae bacterium]